MAHLWVEQGTGEKTSEWGVVSLDGPVFYLTGDAERPVAAPRDGEKPRNSGAYMMRHNGGPAGTETWILYAAPEPPVYVNGKRLDLGIHVLAERDEIRLASHRMLFSSQRAARVEPFPGIGRPGPCPCPRCRQPIEIGDPAVRCPNCGTWYHQSDDLPCYTYAPRCAVCKAPTELSGEFQWTPEDL
ncbi:MAG TPA: hypothetical protein VMZ92_16515 [Planctomycetota bacterium]|nr:hypothetical protein [Planctomycetota bacterium]